LVFYFNQEFAAYLVLYLTSLTGRFDVMLGRALGSGLLYYAALYKF